MSIPVVRLRIIRNDMLLVFGSTFALLASAFIYYKYQRRWLFIMRKALYDVKYNLIGSKAVVSDFLEAKYNRIDLPKKKGKVAIITGGSRGIGAEIVRMLLQCDMEVIIACRTPTAGDEMIRRIRESGVSEGTARVYLLDNSSFISIRKFAEEIKENYVKIDVLVNNAGVMFPPYEETKDHFEQQWGVNYLSHFLLTSLLLPLLNAAGSRRKRARIVNVSSCAHTVGTINFEDINCKEQFITASAYAQSKLAQVMFTKSLQELMDEKGLYIHAYAVHPGVVNTDLFEHTMMKRYCGWILDVFFKTPTQGATPIVYAAVNESIEEKSGIYISNCRETPVNPQVMNESIRKRLFELSLEQVQLTDFFHAL